MDEHNYLSIISLILYGAFGITGAAVGAILGHSLRSKTEKDIRKRMAVNSFVTIKTELESFKDKLTNETGNFRWPLFPHGNSLIGNISYRKENSEILYSIVKAYQSLDERNDIIFRSRQQNDTFIISKTNNDKLEMWAKLAIKKKYECLKHISLALRCINNELKCLSENTDTNIYIKRTLEQIQKELKKFWG